MKIMELDKNFNLANIPADIEVKYYDVSEEPFGLFGVSYYEDGYKRMPEEEAAKVSPAVKYMCGNCAGGRVTFRTNSKFVAVVAKMCKVEKTSHFTALGSCGFDLYSNGRYAKSFLPEYDVPDDYDGIATFNDGEMREIVINFPTYSGVRSLMIGLEPSAVVETFNPYRAVAPIVYYGSSITQGGCVSRPGNTYQGEVARRNKIDFINLGFSGNAKGEPAMAEYIAGLKMSAFVMDYDYNAPSVEHLKKTHEPFYKIIREKNPDLPVIMVSMPVFIEDGDTAKRREVIYNTYVNAKNRGENVAFVDGKSFFDGVPREFGTVDGCHPNDFGFYMMAETLSKVIDEKIG